MGTKKDTKKTEEKLENISAKDGKAIPGKNLIRISPSSSSGARSSRKVSQAKIAGVAKKIEAPKIEARNEVHLVGRVSSMPQERELPSGDLVVEFRIVVDRKTTTRQHRSQGDRGDAPSEIDSSGASANRKRRVGVRREVDTLDLAAWSPKVRKKALGLEVDQWVSIDGAVRRRFWQAPSGLASRWQVEVTELARMK